MSRTPQPPASTPGWPRRHKRLLTLAGIVLLLIAVFGISALYYIRSGRLNSFILTQVQAALSDYGVRADIGGLDLSWGVRTAKAHDIKLYNLESGDLIAAIDNAELVVEIPDLFALRLRRDIIFKRIALDNLQASVQLDTEGKTNFSGLHNAPPSAPGRISFDFSSLVGSLTSGTLHINDQAHHIAGDIEGLRGNAEPLPDGGTINLQFSFGPSRLRYEGRDTTIDGLDLAAHVGNTGAAIDHLKVTSPLGEINTNGKIEDWRTLRYNAGVQARVVLSEAARVFAPELGLQGSATFNGGVDGEGPKYKVSGAVRSDDLAAPGERLRGASIDDVKVESDGQRIAFSSSRARASSATARGNQLIGIAANHISGEIRDGDTRANVQQVTVARVGLPQGQALGIAAAGIRADVKDGRTILSLGQITIARVLLREGQLDGIALRGPTVNLANGRYQIKGNLEVRSGVMRGSQVGPVRGQLAADNNAVALNRFDASVMGGTATGDVVVATGRRGSSRLAASLTDLKSKELFKLLDVNDAPLTGTVNGQLNVSWPGSNFEAVSGNINAHLSAQTTQTEGVIPVNGDVAIRAESGTFNVDQLSLASDVTQLTANGQIATKGNASDLRFSLTSTRAEELQTIAYSIKEVKDAVSSFEPRLGGDFRFDGRLTGSLSDPAVEGDLTASNIGAYDQTIGSVTGHLRFSPQEVAFENGVLATTDGGTAHFTYSAPRAEVATSGRLDATIDHINIETITAAAGLSSQQKVITGSITGEAHLTGLPGSPTGAATINLVNGTVESQAVDTGTASLVFDGKTARLERAELRFAHGQLTASGQYDLKNNDFELQGRADNVDLNQLATSLNLTSTNITGIANATFQATGNTKDLGELKVEAAARGQNVTVNGRSAGELSLMARTNSGGRIDVDLVTGIVGKPQPLHASIELRRPGRPITVESTFTDFDIAPLVAAFAPDAASSIAGMVNGRLYIIGPIENDKGEMTFDGLRGDLTLNTISFAVNGRAINIQTPLAVTLNGPQVALNQTRIYGQGFDLRLGGTLGLNGDTPLNFALTGTANLDSLGQPGPDVFLAGTVAIDARLTGTTNDPRLGGEIRLDKLSVSGADLPVAIDNGNGRIVLAGDRITIESFTAQANEGNLSAAGSMTLAQLRPKDWHFAVTGNNVNVQYEGAQIIANANIDLTGTPERQVLSGTVNIPEGEYSTNVDFANLAGGSGSSGGLIFGGGGSAIGSGAFGLPPVDLDLHINAPGTLLIRNQQINTVGSAALTVYGTISEPNITGRVSLEGGTIKLRGQRYEIMTGTLDFSGGDSTPEVNLQTEADISTYHVYVGLVGPLDQLEITLRSDPDLPRSDVLSLVATGHINTSTFGSQDVMSTGFGAAASLLTGELISQPAESLLGLNVFQIDPVLNPNTNPAARVTIGKQLTRDLTLSYSTNVGAEQDQSAIVEYTVSNRFAGIASYTQGGTITNGARTNSDFTIEVRGRRRFPLGFEQPPGGTATLTGTATTPRPSRPARPALPPAEVTLDNPAGIKLSSKKLRELVPAETQGFSRQLARLGERNLENYLQERGYFFASVRSRCEPIDCGGPTVHLLYDIKPGQRLDLDDVRLEGTDQLSIRDVGGDLQSKKASIFGAIPFLKGLPLIGGYARGITSDDRIRHDREVIRSRMGDLGFRSARVTSRTDSNSQSPDLILTFHVDEGPRADVADITFKGNTMVSSTELRKKLSLKDGDAFSPTKARESTRNIKTFYGEQGFLDTTAPYTIIDLAPDRVALQYNVTEGAQAIVAEIEVTGQTKTREASIRRFFLFKPGTVLTPSLIRRTQRDLYATGAFSEVAIRKEPIAGNPEARKVTVQVTEAKPLLVVYGLGFSTDEGPRGLLQLSDTNLFGRANSISLRMRGSFREELVQLQYTDLRVFSSPWAATISAFYDRNSNLRTFVQRRLVTGGTAPNNGPGFGINRFVAFLQAERKFSEITSLRFRYSFENSKLFNLQNIPLEEIARNETAIRLGLFSAGLTRDTRNSVLNPTKGQLISVEHSVAARPFGGNEAFNKFFTNYQRYFELPRTTPLLRDTVLAFAARVGLSAPFNIRGSGPNGSITEPDRELPISQRFFSGGATTLRGFRFEEAGPQGILEPRNAQELPTLVPLGGDAMVILNSELRYPLTKQLRLVPFYDFGNVFRKVSDISFGGMTHTIGIGLRLNTPIGPVGIDYGYLLDPPSFTSATGIILRQPQGVIHIRFGQSF